MVGLAVHSLVCSVFAGSPADALPQLRDQPSWDRVSRAVGSPRQDAGKMPLEAADAAGCELFSLVEPNKDPLVVEPGRSRLLRFPQGIRRTVVSNADSSDVVQVGPKDVLVLGRKPGTANLTVWPASPRAVPAVIVVRVERRLRRDE